MKPYLLVALGAALGANARYIVGLWATARFGAAFPYGTLAINILGSLLIGVILGLASGRLTLSEPLRLLLVTGVLGGFTTFSAFSWETLTLLDAGRFGAAAAYLLLSVGGGLAAVALGAGLARLTL